MQTTKCRRKLKIYIFIMYKNKKVHMQVILTPKDRRVRTAKTQFLIHTCHKSVPSLHPNSVNDRVNCKSIKRKDFLSVVINAPTTFIQTANTKN